MYTYTSINTDNDNYKLSAILHNGVYDMTSLDCKDVNDETIFCWDNDEWLINELYPMLTGDKPFDSETEESLPIEDIAEVLELFNEAIKLGFFKNINK